MSMRDPGPEESGKTGKANSACYSLETVHFSSIGDTGLASRYGNLHVNSVQC
jgi:hypothetical protein